MTEKEKKILDLKSQLAIEVIEYASSLTDKEKWCVGNLSQSVTLVEIGVSIYQGGNMVSVFGKDETLYERFVSKEVLKEKKRSLQEQISEIDNQLNKLDNHECNE